jgi:hypothetical protein
MENKQKANTIDQNKIKNTPRQWKDKTWYFQLKYFLYPHSPEGGREYCFTSVRPSVRPSIHPSVRPRYFSSHFSQQLSMAEI